VRFKTNRAGGLLGGISNGEEIRIRVAVKPTPTIFKQQDTVDVGALKNVRTEFSSRSDPTILTRIYPVCEAMVRMAILDSILITYGYRGVSNAIDPKWDEI
jgi:chorismate synthase